MCDRARVGGCVRRNQAHTMLYRIFKFRRPTPSRKADALDQQWLTEDPPEEVPAC